MIKKCLVCGKHFDTTKIGRYKYCSEKCAKSKNKNNYLRDISTLRFEELIEAIKEAYSLSEYIDERIKALEQQSEKVMNDKRCCISSVTSGQ